MLNHLILLRYNRDLCELKKDWWEKDKVLSKAIWDEAYKIVYNATYASEQSGEAKSYQIALFYDYISSLIESEDMDI